MMNILLSCVGYNDPFCETDGGAVMPGPLLTLLEERQFDEVCILWNTSPQMNAFAGQSVKEISKQYPKLRLETFPMNAEDPTDYETLKYEMKRICLAIRKIHAVDEAHYSIQVSSGTPQMQWTWMAMVHSGIIPAKIIALRPRYLKKFKPPYSYEVMLDEVGLHNTVELDELRCVAVRQSNEIEWLKAHLEQLRLEASAHGRGGVDVDKLPDSFSLSEYLEDEKKRLYAAAYVRYMGNAAEAARLLGVEPHTFRKEADRLGLRARRKKSLDS